MNESPMVLCCGEALIDMLPRQMPDAGQAYLPFVGGAVCNTAIGLARLGVRTGLLTGLSNDLFGRQLADALTIDGVDLGHAVRSTRPSTLAFVSLRDGQAEYAFFDEGSALRALTPEQMPALGDDVTALFFGGISLATEPCGQAMLSVAERYGASRFTMVDPNIRPGFIADESAYRARLERLLQRSDCIKISAEDLHWWLGQGDPIALGARLLDRGPAIVLVTEGERGATLLTRELTRHLPAPRVAVVDTVGAGDAFNAGWLAGLSSAAALHTLADGRALPVDALEAALARAVAAASVTVTRAGASPPAAADIDESLVDDLRRTMQSPEQGRRHDAG
ncbi:MAG: carbohydrate kinase [Burkholderiaceae bacterium]